MTVRAIRGATHPTRDVPVDIAAAVVELLGEMLIRNEVTIDDLIFAFFTATADLVSAFPAAGAREFGLGEVPLLCAQELAVDGAATSVVRVMLLADTEVPRASISHVYLRGTHVLREDLAQ